MEPGARASKEAAGGMVTGESWVWEWVGVEGEGW